MKLLLVVVFLVHAAGLLCKAGTGCANHNPDLVLSDGNPDAKRLYDEILAGYNKLVRPVKNVTDPVTVKFKLKLSQLIDVVSQFYSTLKLVYDLS